MEEQLISFETAKLADCKGFSECYAQRRGNVYYENEKIIYSEVGRPNYLYCTTQSLLQKWLRDIHQIEIHIDCITENNYINKTIKVAFYQYLIKSSSNYYFINTSNKNFKTYEEALEEALQETLKLL